MSNQKVRVRFAPSPTGPLHIGGVRTALYNYLFAKKLGGSMILRIEDTDQGRFVPGAEAYIIESLTWLGIKFDEADHVGGAYGPYRQSDRKHIYREYIDILLNSGWAYYAFDKPEELEAKRKLYESEKKTFQYDSCTRLNMNNSLVLTTDEVQQLLTTEHSYVVRFKMPTDIEVKVTDLIRGEVVVHSNLLDDKVLYKSDGMPTYHLANIVDDHLMEISHVIRGEEWLPSAPLHVMLYKAFGWEDTMPKFAHLPLLLKPDGNGKLSKRDGDRLGFPVFPLKWTDPKTGEVSSGYRESGYFPEALVNILAFLGWNPGTEKEQYTMEELIHDFSIERISKSGAKFDLEKAKWFNHQYLIHKRDAELAESFNLILKENGITVNLDFVIRICGLMKERVHFISEFWTQAHFFFQAPDSYDQDVIKKKWKAETPLLLEDLAQFLEGLESFDEPELETAVKVWLEEKQIGMGQIMNGWRLVTVGSNAGPAMFQIASIIGKAETIQRIRKGIASIQA
jgi:glutamyl-tRNA synthetase